MSGKAQHLSYRADIDGLRAIAVLFVIAFHAFPAVAPAGFVGVDVFFVISGYMITGILLKNLEAGPFSFGDFYSRRVRRIFPALILILAAVLACGWFANIGEEYEEIGRQVFAGATFSANFLFRAEAGYFNPAAITKPLLHLWSLAIEEQFYICWPILLLLLFKLRKQFVVGLSLVAGGSFIACVVMTSQNSVEAFYFPLTRFWELALGGLLAAWLAGPLRENGSQDHAWCAGQVVKSFWAANVMAFSGLALLLAGFTVIRADQSFPGYGALLPTLGTLLVIAAGERAWLNRYILANRVLVGVGLISYPLYLWHWPLLSFAHHINTTGSVVPPAIRWVCIAASFVLAWLTYRVVEQPVRALPSLLTVGILCGLMVGVGAAGATVLDHDGFPQRFAEQREYLAYFENEMPAHHYEVSHHMDQLMRKECDFYDLAAYFAGRATDVPRASIDAVCYTKPAGTKATVFLWGDSHVQHLYSGLREALPKDIAILIVASSSCHAKVNEQNPESFKTQFCARSNSFAVATIKRVKPDVVILGQRERHEAGEFLATARYLKSIGVAHVLVMGPVPTWEPELYKILATRYWGKFPRRLQTNEAAAENEALEGGLTGHNEAEFVNLIKFFCNGDGCLTYLGDDAKEGLTTFDYGHLTPRASLYVAHELLAPLILKDLGSTPPSEKTSH